MHGYLLFIFRFDFCKQHTKPKNYCNSGRKADNGHPHIHSSSASDENFKEAQSIRTAITDANAERHPHSSGNNATRSDPEAAFSKNPDKIVNLRCFFFDHFCSQPHVLGFRIILLLQMMERPPWRGRTSPRLIYRSEGREMNRLRGRRNVHSGSFRSHFKLFGFQRFRCSLRFCFLSRL